MGKAGEARHLEVTEGFLCALVLRQAPRPQVGPEGIWEVCTMRHTLQILAFTLGHTALTLPESVVQEHFLVPIICVMFADCMSGLQDGMAFCSA